MSELNEYEMRNISQAVQKYLMGKRRNWRLHDLKVLKQIHKDMFNETWKWAGKFRQTDTQIGSDWTQVQVHAKEACNDLEYWIANKVFPLPEIAVRFHHRLIWIHPFPNGNGRHGRIVADIFMRMFGERPFSWGGAHLTESGPARSDYLSAMRRADKGQFEELIAFAKLG